MIGCVNRVDVPVELSTVKSRHDDVDVEARGGCIVWTEGRGFYEIGHYICVKAPICSRLRRSCGRGQLSSECGTSVSEQ